MLPKMVQVVEASEPEKEVDDMHNDKQNEGAAHVMDYWPLRHCGAPNPGASVT